MAITKKRAGLFAAGGVGFLGLAYLLTKRAAAAYECPYCGEPFADEEELLAHLEAEHPEQEALACPYCGETFPTAGELEAHILVEHPGQPSFVCAYCGLIFPTQEELDTHIAAGHPTPLGERERLTQLVPYAAYRVEPTLGKSDFSIESLDFAPSVAAPSEDITINFIISLPCAAKITAVIRHPAGNYNWFHYPGKEYIPIEENGFVLPPWETPVDAYEIVQGYAILPTEFSLTVRLPDWAADYAATGRGHFAPDIRINFDLIPKSVADTEGILELYIPGLSSYPVELYHSLAILAPYRLYRAAMPNHIIEPLEATVSEITLDKGTIGLGEVVNITIGGPVLERGLVIRAQDSDGLNWRSGVNLTDPNIEGIGWHRLAPDRLVVNPGINLVPIMLEQAYSLPMPLAIEIRTLIDELYEEKALLSWAFVVVP